MADRINRLAEARAKVTQREIAERAGVSQSAVSMILARRTGISFPAETRERVRRVAEELGYYRRRGATGNLGFLPTDQYSTPDRARSRFYGRFLDGILRRAAALGRHVMVELWHDTKRVPDFVVEGAIDGLIIQQRYPAEYVERLRKHVPLVFLNLFPHGQKVTSILPDNASGIRRAVEHLREMGHRRIGFFGIDPIAGREHVLERTNAFRETLRAFEMDLDERIIRTPKERRKDHSDQTPLTAQAVEQLMKLKRRPTAIVSYGDGVLLPFISIAREKGWRCPEQFGAIGFDNLDTCEHSRPPLTSVDQPMEEMGAAAVDELLAAIDDPERAVRHQRFECRLKVRDSVRRIGS